MSLEAAASASSNTCGGYSAPACRGGNGYCTPSHNGGGNYRAPSVGGSTSALRDGNGGHPTWADTTGGTPGTTHWGGNDLYVDTKS